MTRRARRSRVVVCGPATWNHLIQLDRLPEPVPHMQFARRAWHTVGGTSAGKALHLSALRVETMLHASIGGDDDGARLRAALDASGLAVEAVPSDRTERHVNLMTAAGERVSLYVATPSPPPAAAIDAAARDLRVAEIGVVDLGELGAALLDRAGGTPLWIDLHDYDGSSAYHEPFVRAADVVFLNDDRTTEPWALMRSCLDRGPRLAVCTRGAAGAIALTAAGERFETAAVPADVVDTNGAGDAFLAGFLAARLAGAPVDACLGAAAAQARVAIESRHLHPLLDAVLGR